MELINPTLLIQHILVLFLAIGVPLWDLYEVPRLKASTQPDKKLRYYWKVSTGLWTCAAVAVLAIGIQAAFTVSAAAREISWIAAGSAGRIFLEGVTIGICIVIFVPALLALRSEKIRTRAGKAAKRLSYLLPSSLDERRWWWLVCLTAGICEEVLYRGFLLHYFHSTPLHLTWMWALIISSLIFGVGHLYQGIAGSVQTVVLGFLLGALFLITGSLLLPIVLHALLDLRVLAMLPEGFSPIEA